MRVLPNPLRSRHKGATSTKSKQTRKALDIATAGSRLEFGRNRENLAERHDNRLVFDLFVSIILERVPI